MTKHISTPENLPQINFQSVPVVTTKQLADLYGTDKTNITSNFHNHRNRFGQGRHFYIVKGAELKEIKRLVNTVDQPIVHESAPYVYVWTERGAARHAKLLDTDQAWDVFEKLEECYFNGKKEQPPSLPTNFSEALYLAAQQAEEIERLKIEAQENSPRVEFAKAIEVSPDSISVGDYVKILSNTYNLKIGRNNFFAWMRSEKIVTNNNRPYQRYISHNWLELRESTYDGPKGPVPCFTTMVTGKGQFSLLTRFTKSPTAPSFINR